MSYMSQNLRLFRASNFPIEIFECICSCIREASRQRGQRIAQLTVDTITTVGAGEIVALLPGITLFSRPRYFQQCRGTSDGSPRCTQRSDVLDVMMPTATPFQP